MNNFIKFKDMEHQSVYVCPYSVAMVTPSMFGVKTSIIEMDSGESVLVRGKPKNVSAQIDEFPAPR